MTTFLTTWNPDKYTELADRWASDGETLKSAGHVDGRWAVGNRTGGIESGDRVFLVRQLHSRGIVRSGLFTSEVYQDAHWDPVRGKSGVLANYADVRWTSQSAVGNPLSTDTLLELVPEVPWNVLLGSGVQVPQEAAQTLIRLWQEHVGAPSQRNPDWTWDEEVLAFDVYQRFGAVDDEHPEVIALSQILRSLPIHPIKTRTSTFRNPNGVARKLGDIRTHEPGYTGKPTSGSKLDREVWRQFGDDQNGLDRIVSTIRSSADEAENPEDDEAEIEELHHEGRIFYRMHRTRERDPKLRKRKIAQQLKLRGELRCEACDLALEAIYGETGSAVYECHHIQPLSTSGETITTLSDVALLCPNCHRVAHRISPWPSLSALQSHVSHPDRPVRIR